MPLLLISDDFADGVPPAAQHYDPEPRRDWVRAGITVLLVLTFIGIIAFALDATRGGKDVFDRTKEMIDKLLPALTGLIGTALGFYFGVKTGPEVKPSLFSNYKGVTLELSRVLLRVLPRRTLHHVSAQRIGRRHRHRVPERRKEQKCSTAQPRPQKRMKPFG